MPLLLKVVLFFLGYLLYAAIGFVLAATLSKRYSASWKWVNSNLGEMVMSMHLIEMVVLSVFWPIQLGIGIMLSLPRYIKDWRERRRWALAMKNQRAPLYSNSLTDDMEGHSLYLTTIKPMDKKTAAEWRHKHEGR